MTKNKFLIYMIGLFILFGIGLIVCMVFESKLEGKNINNKGYKCSGQNTYFWLDIDGTRCGVNYDIWRSNVVGKPYTVTIKEKE